MWDPPSPTHHRAELESGVGCVCGGGGFFKIALKVNLKILGW